MATAYIAEFSELPVSPIDVNNSIPVAEHPADVQQTVSFTTSAQSSVFAETTTILRIVSDETCRYLVGSNPTAVAGSNYLPAGTVEYIGVKGGDRIAFYDGNS